MKVGVIGSGIVGQVLGNGFLRHGHEVVIGTRNPGKLEGWAKDNPKGCGGSFADTAGFGEVVVLAVGGSVAGEALAAAGAGRLAGKVVLDATDPISGAPKNGGPPVFTDYNGSQRELFHLQVYLLAR